MVLIKRDIVKMGSPAKFRRFNRDPPGASHGQRTPGGNISCVRNLGKSSEANVKVVVRVRPLNKKELANNTRTIVKIVDEKMLIFDPKEEEESSFFYRGIQQKGRDMLKRQHKHTQFLFDRVFGFDSTNQQVFGESTKDIITSVLDGYNCSVFVYGATGAGKTFTMLGSEENPGIMFLTMVGLFERMEQLKVDRDFEMGVSYLEVYNETVNDLITGSSPLYLREDPNGVFVSGLKIERIHDTARLFELLAEGNKNRTQHPTDANAESSRSHAVFQVYLKMTAKGSNQTKMVKLSMIDLAGSEKGSATNFAGARFKEGSSINKSLLALGNCINKLADGLPHIPYRDSKLTRILKDSLGGNCRTVMIANISPSHSTFEDTLNTLRYAKRAKMIKSTAKKNIVSVEMHVSHYIKMVDDLKEENARLKADLAKAEAALEASKCVNAANPVYTTPVKAVPVPHDAEKDDPTLQSLLEEVERLFSEKRELQRRYLQMDSKEKVLKWRIEWKQRSVARVEQLSDTPTNTQEAMFRATRSLKQFCGQLESAMDCQEGLADKRNELGEKLKSLRDRATALGLVEQFAEKVEKMDLEFQNAQLMEQQAHLQKVITLLSKEKEDQDQVMTELSAAFRRYYNLLRGHGHMTDAMLREHKSLVRRCEGLKTVNWQEMEENDPIKDPPALNSISKLSISDSPLAGSRSVPSSPPAPVENVKPSSADILKSNDGDIEGRNSLEPYKTGSFDIDRIKRDIEKISSMALPTLTTKMGLPTTATTMEVPPTTTTTGLPTITTPTRLPTPTTTMGLPITTTTLELPPTTTTTRLPTPTTTVGLPPTTTTMELPPTTTTMELPPTTTTTRLPTPTTTMGLPTTTTTMELPTTTTTLELPPTTTTTRLPTPTTTMGLPTTTTTMELPPATTTTRLPTPTTTMGLRTTTTTMELPTATTGPPTATTSVGLPTSTTTTEIPIITIVEKTLKPCTLNDSLDDDEFCIQGKFAHFNATFDKINEDIDATINKVDNLLNESYTVQTRSLNVTFDAERQELNKTFDKTDLPSTNVTENLEMNQAGHALNLTFTNDEDKRDKAEEAVNSTPLGASQDKASLNTTFQLVVTTPQQSHKFVKPSAVLYTRTNVPAARRPKLVLPLKKPLQESNSLQRKERTPVKVAAEKTKSTVPVCMKAPIAANASYMSLERKFPLNPRLKSKTLLGNKENGAPRKC